MKVFVNGASAEAENWQGSGHVTSGLTKSLRHSHSLLLPSPLSYAYYIPYILLFCWFLSSSSNSIFSSPTFFSITSPVLPLTPPPFSSFCSISFPLYSTFHTSTSSFYHLLLLLHFHTLFLGKHHPYHCQSWHHLQEWVTQVQDQDHEWAGEQWRPDLPVSHRWRGCQWDQRFHECKQERKKKIRKLNTAALILCIFPWFSSPVSTGAPALCCGGQRGGGESGEQDG